MTSFFSKIGWTDKAVDMKIMLCHDDYQFNSLTFGEKIREMNFTIERLNVKFYEIQWMGNKMHVEEGFVFDLMFLFEWNWGF